METTTITAENLFSMPQIEMKLNPKLLSTPTWGFDADYLHKIAWWILGKIGRSEFKNMPNTKSDLRFKYHKFMELYDQAKTKEKESKGKATRKSFQIFYRPRFDNESDEYLFRRLDNRRKTSERMRNSGKCNEISKI